VEQNIDKSLRRMNTEALDLLQFHWWDYEDERYLEALSHLSDLRDQGKIQHLGLTNFDTDHLRKVIESGIRVISNQVQYSLIDRRPEVQMAPYCQQNGIHLLAYGTVAGGLLSERYVGQPEPPRPALDTASLGKYKQMQKAWGSWEVFQNLLATLADIAQRYNVSVPNVAVRYVLDRPAVAGVIVGARLGVADHRQDNSRAFNFTLSEEDLGQIESALQDSHDLYQIIGDCGDEYRE
jgi:aryl-alcohol dehydrogenase-like predicted oxidoreductase